MRKTKAIVFLGFAALCLGSTAFGADTVGDGTSPSATVKSSTKDSETVETVVVTAERRSSSLQKVPLSIQAFSAETLEKTGTDSNMSLQFITPGLVLSSHVGIGHSYIRGIGNEIFSPGADSAVAMYVNGVYQPRPSSVMMNFVDVERIEVLKGPQGTLYGRNATGGAINVVSKAPSREVEGKVDVQLGSFNQRILRGTVSGPLSEGAAYGRLSVVFNKDDGYMKNILLDTRGLNNDIQAVRGALELTPSDQLNVVLNANYFVSNFNSLVKGTSYAIGAAWKVYNAERISDPYTVKNEEPSEFMNKQYGVDATIKYDLNWAELTSLTAVTINKFLIKSWDSDWSEIPLVKYGFKNGSGNPIDTNAFSQELTLVSNTNGPWQWTALASFGREKTDYTWGLRLPIANIATTAIGVVNSESMGVGGQVSYSLGNGVTLTAGTRYSKDTRKNTSVTTTNDVVSGRQDAEKTWTASTPKLVAEYAPTKTVMLYTSAAKGFKSGGFNALAISPAWSPEKVTSYEAGTKSSWLDGKLRVNAAVFDMKYTNLQVQVSARNAAGVATTSISNAAKATSKGFELDFAVKPTSRFLLSGGLQVLRAKFDDYSTINTIYPALGLLQLAGNPLTRSPELTVNLGMQYTWPSALKGKDVTLRADAYHRTKMYFTNFKDDLAAEPTLDLFNVNLSFEPTGNRGIYGSVFIKNLTNKVYHTMLGVGATAGYFGYLGAPRTIGVQLGYKY